jgi:hypothetical protein
LGRGEIALPEVSAFLNRLLDLLLYKGVQTVHHANVEIALPGQRLRARQVRRLFGNDGQGRGQN